MGRNTVNVAKGVGVGLAAGVAAGIIGTRIMNSGSSSKRKRVSPKKRMNRAMNTVGDIVDSVQNVFKG